MVTKLNEAMGDLCLCPKVLRHVSWSIIGNATIPLIGGKNGDRGLVIFDDYNVGPSPSILAVPLLSGYLGGELRTPDTPFLRRLLCA